MDHPYQSGWCVHLVMLDTQSSRVPKSHPPDHIADMWPAQADPDCLLYRPCDTMLVVACDLLCGDLIAGSVLQVSGPFNFLCRCSRNV